MRIQSLVLEDPLEEKMTTQYSYLENSMDRGAWRTTVYESMGSQRVDTTEHRRRQNLRNISLTGYLLSIQTYHYQILRSFHYGETAPK